MLISRRHFFIYLTWFLFVPGFFTGCSRCDTADREDSKGFVLRSGPLEISIHEFADELEVRRTAYAYEITAHPLEYNELILRLVDELSDELIICRHAREKGISVEPSRIKEEEERMCKGKKKMYLITVIITNGLVNRKW